MTTRGKTKAAPKRNGWLKAAYLTAKDVRSVIGAIAIIVGAIAWFGWNFANRDHELVGYIDKYSAVEKNMDTVGDRFCGR